MWREFIVRVVVCLIVFGFVFRGLACKSSGEAFIMALAFALLNSVPRLVFGYFPELDSGWMSYAVVVGVALAVCILILPLMALTIKRRKRHDHDA
jgi:hypothetical protein